MAARCLDGIVDSATRSAHADHVMLHARLRHQILKSLVYIARPLLGHHLRRLLWSQLVESVAPALTKAPVIQGEHVDSRRSKLPGEAIPDLALAVSLMQHKKPLHSLASGEITCAEHRS